MKNTYSIAMLSLLVFAPAAFAGKKETAIRCAKSVGRVVVGAALGHASIALDEKVSDFDYFPNNVFLRAKDEKARYGKLAYAGTLVRCLGMLTATQALREKAAKFLDSKLSDEGQNTILDGSRAAATLSGYDYHYGTENQDRAGLYNSMAKANKLRIRIASLKTSDTK